MTCEAFVLLAALIAVDRDAGVSLERKLKNAPSVEYIRAAELAYSIPSYPPARLLEEGRALCRGKARLA